MTLIIAGGHKVSTKQNLLAAFSHFSTELDEIWCTDEAIQAEHPEITFERELLIQGQ